MTYDFNIKRITDNFNYLNQFDEVNLIWKGDDKIDGLCKPSKTGHGSTLFDKLQPINYHDFYFKLTEYANNNKTSLRTYERGLTQEEFIKVGLEFKSSVEKLNPNLKFLLTAYLDYIAYVNVIQTFNGHINEVMLVKYLQNNGYADAHKVSGILDSRYGVDILYDNDTKGIQVKAITFFLGKKTSVINDRKLITPLKEEVLQKFNIQMEYAIFDRNNNKYLQNHNGTPIFTHDEFVGLLFPKTTGRHPIFDYTRMND